MNTAAKLLLVSALASALAACNRTDDGIVAPADLDVAPAAQTDAARSRLERAHSAYAAGQGRAMARELIGVLQDPTTDDVARSNALGLLDRAFAEHQGNLDAGFELPAGMPWIRLLFQHASNDGITSHLAILNGGLTPGVELRDISLTRLRDGRLIASKANQMGYFETGTEGNERYFYIHSPSFQSPLESGAYKIRWAYTDGREGEADMLMPSVYLGAVPEILDPARGSASESTRPTFRWKLPGWVSDRTFGRLLIDARVSELTSEGSPLRWSMWEHGATRTEVTLGAVGTPTGATLAAGKPHRFSVQTDWRLRYGDLQIGTSARASRTFDVSAGR